MYRRSDFTKSAYKTGEVAELLGLSTRTIQEYDKQGKLHFTRNAKDRRILLVDDLIQYLKDNNMYEEDKLNKRDVIYARVSSHDQQKNGDLDRQALFLTERVNDLINPLILKEVGSGLNDKRKNLNKLIQMVMNDEVNRVFVTYKDRLTRFGFNYLNSIFEVKGVPIIVVKDVSKQKNVQEELVEDMMSLIASFSGKLYGLRSKGNKKKQNNN